MYVGPNTINHTHCVSPHQLRAFTTPFYSRINSFGEKSSWENFNFTHSQTPKYEQPAKRSINCCRAFCYFAIILLYFELATKDEKHDEILTIISNTIRWVWERKSIRSSRSDANICTALDYARRDWLIAYTSHTTQHIILLIFPSNSHHRA